MLGSIWRTIKFLTPGFNRALSKFGYEMAAKNFQFEDWRFMNFGYVYPQYLTLKFLKLLLRLIYFLIETVQEY